jgi:hypothetical protein
MASTIRTTRVAIDPVTADDVFVAQVDDRSNNWNGWACPSFTPAEARRVEAWSNRINGALDPTVYTYNLISVSADGRWATLVTLDGVLDRRDNDPAEIYTEVLENVEGLGLGIGSWGWTWSECDDLPTDPQEINTVLAVQAAATTIYCETWNTALTAAYARGEDATGAYAAAQAAVNAAGL